MLKIGKTDNSMYTARYITSAADYAHLQTEEMQERYRRIELAKGKNCAFIRSMRDGEFSESEDERKVFVDIDLRRVRDAMRRPKGSVLTGKKRIGFDVSVTAKGDPKVLYLMDGLYVYPPFVSREEDTTIVAQWAVDIAKQYGVEPRDFTVDAGGSGKPVADDIESTCKYAPIERYMNNQSARFGNEYEDRITEDHWIVKQILKDYELAIADNPDLYSQMRDREFVEGRHEKAKLQNKKDHRKLFGESPDHLDAFVMMLSNFFSAYKARGVKPPKEKPKGRWRPPSTAEAAKPLVGRFGMTEQMSMNDLIHQIQRK